MDYNLFSIFFFISLQTKTVTVNLPAGTAMNVTMKGNYTKIEVPYSAKLISYYADENESMSREIGAEVSIEIYVHLWFIFILNY